MDLCWLETYEDGVRLRVRVKPRASRSRILGLREGSLEIAVAAAPVDGEANAELAFLVAKALGCARSAVRVVAGHKGRKKTLAVQGVAEVDVRRTFAEAPS
jgi:uncharacterized protein (TIGR00251 family)